MVNMTEKVHMSKFEDTGSWLEWLRSSNENSIWRTVKEMQEKTHDILANTVVISRTMAMILHLMDDIMERMYGDVSKR